KAALAKSLNFLATGPSKNVNALTTSPNAKRTEQYAQPGNALIPAGNSVLGKIANSAAPSGPIETSSSRTVSTDSGIAGGHGKGLNQVLGKVAMNAIYGNGSGEALGAAVGEGMSISGAGSLSDAEIEKTLAKYLSKLQRCYERELLSNPNLRGLIQIKWSISVDGNVHSQAIVRSELNVPKLHDCLLSEFTKMQFPRPKGGEVQVKKPFKFEASAM
ncbi:hypothetical protein EB061_07560, partial [bacterium]|nr:hypothetical protein [bacterium]